MEGEVRAVRAAIIATTKALLEERITPRAGAAELNWAQSELAYLAERLFVFKGLDSQLDDYPLGDEELDRWVTVEAERLRRDLER